NGVDKCGGFHNPGLVDCQLDGVGDPYRIEVFDGGSDTPGKYRLFVHRPSTTATIDCDAPLRSGTIGDAVQQDLVEPTFTVGNEALEINISVVPPVNPNFNPVWRLVDAKGVDKCGGFHGGLANCTPDGFGNPYRIEVADSFNNDAGSYILHLQRL